MLTDANPRPVQQNSHKSKTRRRGNILTVYLVLEWCLWYLGKYWAHYSCTYHGKRVLLHILHASLPCLNSNDFQRYKCWQSALFIAPFSTSKQTDKCCYYLSTFLHVVCVQSCVCNKTSPKQFVAQNFVYDNLTLHYRVSNWPFAPQTQ